MVGFDTFVGFPSVHSNDSPTTTVGELALTNSDVTAIEESIALFDIHRPLSHIPKVELVKGETEETIPAWLKANSHSVVSLF